MMNYMKNIINCNFSVHPVNLDIIWDEDYLKDKENIINSVYNKIINLYEKYNISSQS